MSSTVAEGPVRRHTLRKGHSQHTWPDTAQTELAREIAAQQERLHTLRASMLQHLEQQRRGLGLPRWPSGPKFTSALVDEDEWWSKMLGRKRQAA